jgi:hypothetical protein
MSRLTEEQRKNVHKIMHVFPGARLIECGRSADTLVEVLLRADPQCAFCTKVQTSPPPAQTPLEGHPSPHKDSAPEFERRDSIFHQAEISF